MAKDPAEEAQAIADQLIHWPLNNADLVKDDLDLTPEQLRKYEQASRTYVKRPILTISARARKLAGVLRALRKD